MKSVFEKEGILLPMEGNKPLLLNTSESVSLVHSGTVDIFAVSMKDSQPASPRIHICRVEAGQLLFGTNVAMEEGFILLAAGNPASRLFQMEFRRFEELICRVPAFSIALATAVDQWVANLSLGIRTDMPPKRYREIKPGGEIFASEEENVRPGSGTIWMRQLDGASHFMGKRDLTPIGTEGLYFPVSSQVWLQSAGPSKYRVLDTQICLREGCLWAGLDRFHESILEGIGSNRLEEDAREYERLEVRAENENAVFRNALSKLSAILKTGKQISYISRGEENALMAACLLVGENTGIELKTPCREDMAGRDPLDAIARISKVRKRQVVLKGFWWRQDNGPLLGFLNEDQRPLALIPVSAGAYEIFDPSTGAQTRLTSTVADTLNPFAYMFYRPFPARVLKLWDILKVGIYGDRKDILTVILMAVLGAVLGLVVPIATGIVFDTIIPNAARSQLAQMAIILFACAFAISLLEVCRAVALLRIASKMNASVQTGVMDRLLSLPVSFFRKFTAGDLADRAMGIDAIRQILSGVAVQTILTGVFSFFYLALLFWYDVKLAIIATALALLASVFSAVASIIQVRHQRSASSLQGKIFGMVLQFVTGISKLRLSGTEHRAFAIWATEFGEQRKMAYKAQTVANIVAVFNAVFPVLSSMAIFAWAVMGSLTNLTTGEFLAFNAAYIGLQMALLQISGTLASVLHVVPLYERAKPIIECLPEVDAAKARPGELTGTIELSHVHFRYLPQGPLVLEDVSLSIAQGQFVAIVGASGSGKSTLLRVLLGFEAPEAGAVYYDGQDLASLDIQEVRRQMGVVLQGGGAMAGDIFRNIVGSSNLSLEDAWEAAQMAGFDEDIRQMPMGMQTVLPAGGGTISGGQRQRLLIARAVVHKPRILLFDEATSALDNRTQSIVSRSLEKLKITRVVIAHRLSTIMHADRIHVLEKGRIVESGGYEQLIGREGPFQELAKRQLL